MLLSVCRCKMRYEGSIYRPPSEAYSLLIQVTIGCSHNECTFCTMYKDKRFRVRALNEVIEDLYSARTAYRRVDKIFLCDGDALCLSNKKLIPILNKIKELFPECARVGVYARAGDVLRKSEDELKELKDSGVGILYIGAESGSDKVLKIINKGETSKSLIEGVKKAENAGIKTSVTFISGIGGKELWREHAIETGKMIGEMGASYVSLLTLMIDRASSIYSDIASGKFEVLSADEVLAETYLMLENANPERTCIFRSNHASNYFALRGDLPADRQKMMSQIKMAMEDGTLLKDERFRLL